MVANRATYDFARPMTRPPPARGLNLEWWLVALLSSALVLFLTWDRTTGRADGLAYDLLLEADRRDPDPRIFLVTVDSRSLAEFGPWPWPRDLQARLVGAVAAMEPHAIAYDVLLLEPTEPEADAALARSIGSGSTFLPLLLQSPGENGARFQAALPVSPMREQATGLGHVNLIADTDGLHRRIRLWEGDGRAQWPHLMELMRRSERGTTPTGPSPALLLIPFTGPSGNFPSIAASSVLRGEVPPDFLRGRLVIIGATAEGLADRYPTSHGRGGGVMSGIEIQANILDGLLTERMISDAGFPARAALALVPLWLLLGGFRLLQPRATQWLLALLVAATLIASAIVLLQFRIWLPPVAALAGLALVYPLWGWQRLAAVSKRMLRQLEQLQGEPELLAGPVATVGAADPVSRQAMLLDDAIGRLRALRQFVTETLHQLPDAVFVLDREGRLQLANGEGERLLASLGLAGSDQISSLLERLEPAGPHPMSQPPLEWPPPSAEGSSGEALTPDGRHLELRVTRRNGPYGEAIGWTMRVRDDSEVWLARQQREEMMHFLSHDMRSPQASILALLSTAAPGELSHSLAQRIEGFTRRTLSLADGFVQLARAELLQYREEPLNLADLLIDAVDAVWPQAQSRNVRVETLGDDREWLVAGERSLLTRAIINLLDNALKYSPRDAAVRCVLAAESSGGRQMIGCSISDSGTGMVSGQIRSLFERFKRSANPDGPRAGGSGLGLAFVNTVAARHGGTIRCISKPGKGSTFTFALPLLDE